MGNIIAVGLGGFVGSVLRYAVSLIPVRETMLFPIKTFCINVAGCVAIALVTVLLARSGQQRLVLFLKAGVCGGFTTFSTFALETAVLAKGGHSATVALYVVLSVVVGVCAVVATEFLCSRLGRL